MSIKVPANSTKLTLYAAAWKGVTGLSLNLTGATVSPASISLTADDGISNNSPFTLSGNESDFVFEITLSNITTETTIKFTSSIAKRFVVWGASAEVSGGAIDTRKNSELAWSETSADVTYGTTYTLPTLSYATGVSGITYESTNEEVATIDASGNVTINNVNGTTTIKAVFAGDDDFKPSTATYTLNVSKAFVVEDGVFDFTAGNGYGSGVSPTNEGNTYVEEATTWTAGNVTLVADGKYRMWSAATGYDFRMYSTSPQSTLTISVPSGKVITKVKFDSNVVLSADKGTYASGEWNGVANSVVFEYAANKGAVTIKTISVTYGDCETITISSAGYATYCSENILDFSAVDGLAAYSAFIVDDEVTFVKLEGGVAAGQGVLLKAAEDTYQVPVVATATADTSDNGFVGVNASETKPAGIFVLLKGDKGVGFYKTLNPFTLGAHTAYLPALAGARTFIGFDQTTAINGMSVEAAASNDCYNLQGQRVDNPRKGLYIVNGKKMVIK